MKQFKDLNIKPTIKSFVGDKIKIDKIIDKPIITHAYKIATSKFEKMGKDSCLHLQIELANEKRVVFTGSVTLIDIMKQVPDDYFPFEATIKKIDDRLVLN